MDNKQEFLENGISRLEKLWQADQGFFALAVHAFIEGYICRLYPELGERQPESGTYLEFRERLNDFSERIKLTRGQEHKIADYLGFLSSLAKNHFFTNRIRHDFAELERENAITFLNNLFTFLAWEEAPSEILRRHSSFHPGGGKDYSQLLKENLDLRRQLREFESQVAELNQNLEVYQSYEGILKQADQVSDEIASLKADLEFEQKKSKSDRERVKSLEDKLMSKNSELQTVKNSFRVLKRSEELLQSLVAHSRSRIDWERVTLKLAVEQGDFIQGFSKDKAFHLIKGPAGSGKTLALLKCLERVLRPESQVELFDETQKPERPLLLSYVNMTTEYVKYQSNLLGLFDQDQVMIKSIDSWLVGKVARYLGLKISYRDREFKTELNQFLDQAAGLTLSQLYSELVLINDLGFESQESYLEFNRRGMGFRIASEQRKAVWAIQEILGEQALASSEVWHKLGWYLLDQALAGEVEGRLPWIFVDEVQDLTATRLRLLVKFSEHLVLAGDEDQMIYSGYSPFAKAGIDLRRYRPKVLKHIFRNSAPIYLLAETFRRLMPGAEHEYFGLTNRLGPAPSLIEDGDSSRLRSRLISRVKELTSGQEPLFEPGSLAILCLENKNLEQIEFFFNESGLKSRRLAQDSKEPFDFGRSDLINLGTIHSAKGMDFPVVFLWLENLTQWTKYAVKRPLEGEERPGEIEGLSPTATRLLYVGMTRAMILLEVYLPGDEKTAQLPEARALKKSFADFERSLRDKAMA